MAIDRVREYFREYDREQDILEFDTSSATVELAAITVGVEPARIAKTLCFRAADKAILVVAAGDARMDNGKFKAEFGFKAKMLSAEETFVHTGHEIGGVCPFGLANDVPVFLDVSMKRFESVYPACGSDNSAIQLTCEELETYSKAKKWIDVCKNWE